MKELLASATEKNQARLYLRHGIDQADLGNFKLLPPIRRARDFHVYSFSGTRFLDLHRAEGFSLMGYSPPHFGLGIKNRISQALWQGYPHPMHKQVQNYLARCFPDHLAILCTDKYQLDTILESLDIPVNRPFSPQAGDLANNPENLNLHFWFPFTGQPTSISIAIIPGLSELGPFALLISKKIIPDIQKISIFSQISSNRVPVYALTAMMSGLSVLDGLGAFMKGEKNPNPSPKPALGNSGHPRTKGLALQLGTWQESNWGGLKISAWKRIGPYIYHDFSPAAYAKTFAFALKNDLILNPRSAGVSCLPGVMSDGEKKLLETVLAYQPQGED